MTNNNGWPNPAKIKQLLKRHNAAGLSPTMAQLRGPRR